MLRVIQIFTISLLFIGTTTSYGGVSKIKDLENIRQAIVTINSRIPVSAYQNTGSWSGTGFITDKDKGFIVTNTHVVGRGSVGTYFITFYNGKQAEAKVAYYDSYVDFAILKIDPNELPKQVEKIEFSTIMPKLGDDVFIVGNTEGQGFSFHNGYLSDLFDINGDMPQGTYVINMNSTGGASGSPVLNSYNKAIGVLYGGGKTHALALKGSYVSNILKTLQKNDLPKRAHIGALCYLYSLDKAVKHNSFSKDEMERYIKAFPDARNRVVTIKSILPVTTAEAELLPGDIIWEVDNKQIGADLTILDQQMNESKNGTINLTIFRNGQKLKKEIKLYDLEENKISIMLDFAGALFFEADDYIAAKSGIPIGSVALANVQTGSSFSSIPEMYVQNYKSIYRLVLTSINGTIIKSLNDLINTTNDAIKNKFINITYKNYQPYFPQFGAENTFISAHEELMQDINFDSIDTKPRVLQFDKKAMGWDSCKS